MGDALLRADVAVSGAPAALGAFAPQAIAAVTKLRRRIDDTAMSIVAAAARIFDLPGEGAPAKSSGA